MVRFRNYFLNLYLHMKTECRYTFLFCFDFASAYILQPVSREVGTKSSLDLEVVTELFLGDRSTHTACLHGRCNGGLSKAMVSCA